MTTDAGFLPKKSDDLSEWYLTLLREANLTENGPTRGSIIIKPYAFAWWERVQEIMNPWFAEAGVENLYFPLLIPESLLNKEKNHVAGFSPELAVVTIGGGKELQEKLVIRPTSETIMYDTFKNWISSYKDLPLKINQWCNVVRWELRTFPFLRGSEFLWQEGHTVHASEQEAMAMTGQALDWYKKLYEEYFALSPFIGEKSSNERFAGAERTFSVELIMPDGKALQASTSHYLGLNFSRAYDIKYLDNKNNLVNPHQTSWGLSTRALGGLIMAHGDDKGLILPPKMAKHKVVIMMIPSKDHDKNAKTKLYVQTVADELKKDGITFVIDDNMEKTVGYRFNHIDMMGYPIRLYIGYSEYEEKSVMYSRRDIGEKQKAHLRGMTELILSQLDAMQFDMLEKSKEHKAAMTADVDNFEEFTKIMENERKFIRAFWCENSHCENEIKELTKATTRVVETEEMDKTDDGACVHCGKPAWRKWLFAQSY